MRKSTQYFLALVQQNVDRVFSDALTMNLLQSTINAKLEHDVKNSEAYVKLPRQWQRFIDGYMCAAKHYFEIAYVNGNEYKSSKKRYI
jgi:hypothetical protein